MNAATIDAPAKINLGLEILGQREDGFHEVRSILATIALCDTLSFAPQSGPEDYISVSDARQEIPADQNLVKRALDTLRDAGAEIPPQRITLTKRIPVAAGLGGASSDAAAVLRYFAPQVPGNEHELTRLAAKIGSDVPFFLNGPVALVAGRGERLTPLPQPRSPFWVVSVSPDLLISAKTATMYAAVEPGWWTSGRDVDAYAATFPTPPTQPPINVFSRALFNRFPELSALRDQLNGAGFPFVATTGAGPTLYTICESENDATKLACRVAEACPAAATHASRLCPALNTITDRSDWPNS